MSASIEDRLPAAVAEALADDLARDGQPELTLELVTVREDGRPQVALLSVGEVMTLGRQGVRLEL